MLDSSGFTSLLLYTHICWVTLGNYLTHLCFMFLGHKIL
jgi:hypothetical protein